MRRINGGIDMENNLRRRTFPRDAVLFILFMVPTAFLAIIASVTAHEVIGHGVVAVLLGGKFTGFGIRVDGMGWANVDIIGISSLRQAMVFAGGAVVTTISGLLFFVLGYVWRDRFFRSATLWVFAFAFLCDGIPYFFWDSIYQGVIGDPSAILRLYPSEGMRLSWIIGSGILGIASIWAFNHLMLKYALRFFESRQQKPVKRTAIVAGILFGIQVLAWLSFDWAQLVPVANIGITPYIVPIALTAIALGAESFRALRSTRKEDAGTETPISWKTPLIASWAGAIVVAVAVGGWLQYGVTFR